MVSNYRYTLFLKQESNLSYIHYKEKKGKKVNFKKPITQKGVPKIYVIKTENEIIYVGYANQSLGLRLGQGMRPKGVKGYHGYKWKDKYDMVELLVFTFENMGLNFDNKKNQKLFFQAVEAELVYKIRFETGNWPMHQNEIHFNNHVDKNKVLQIVDSIYKTLTNR
ncbi:hypothetical protein SAMN05444344_3056 [Tenacibaculum mesophilum]|uniref:GIY-YIG domain-containing protein n=1 Tax=Tenacibaculum mesophilum TaxID=104268 RepID=A0ABN5T717_9FLAO|nr:hypothetical protein [Tenacibaculum mesophilum]AZJ32255.1 hypothetical protein D6200_06650 [Tenacibaculum mesophilum]QFS27510.1 hypothetical protein F9Y86_03505 [Tenacibaculum mesophilum]SHG19080.1 hypothetical protein SAMN05444344_3056 [Tenacibaculum mesophilum]